MSRLRRLALLLTPLALLGASEPALAGTSTKPNPKPLWQAHPLGTQPLATNPAPSATTSSGGSAPPRTTTRSGGGATRDGNKAAKPVASRSSSARQPTAALASGGGQGRWGLIVIVLGAGVVTLALAPFILEGRPRAAAAEADDDPDEAEAAGRAEGAEPSPARPAGRSAGDDGAVGERGIGAVGEGAADESGAQAGQSRLARPRTLASDERPNGRR
jgi:hypothetical protein